MKEHTRWSTLEIAGRIEVLYARYFGHAFAPHWHEEFSIGLIDAGVEQFEYAGALHRAMKGEIVLFDAGQVHTGEAFDESGFGFRMLYVPESTFREVSEMPTRRGNGSLHFTTPVLKDGSVWRSFMTAHESLETGASSLEIESRFVNAIASLLMVASSWRTSEARPFVPSAVRAARDYLHDHLFRDISLTELAQISGISKYHFIRAFRERFGLTPHAYQLQQRILRAKHLLRKQPVVDVAHRCGFADQSHLHRVFRAFVGTTPGRYAQQFRTRPI